MRRTLAEVAARPSTVARDALARNPNPLSIETVADKKVLTDGKRSVEIYPITGNGHCASMLMVYFPTERLLAEADAYQTLPSTARRRWLTPSPPTFSTTSKSGVCRLSGCCRSTGASFPSLISWPPGGVESKLPPHV